MVIKYSQIITSIQYLHIEFIIGLMRPTSLVTVLHLVEVRCYCSPASVWHTSVKPAFFDRAVDDIMFSLNALSVNQTIINTQERIYFQSTQYGHKLSQIIKICIMMSSSAVMQ